MRSQTKNFQSIRRCVTSKIKLSKCKAYDFFIDFLGDNEGEALVLGVGGPGWVGGPGGWFGIDIAAR